MDEKQNSEKIIPGKIDTRAEAEKIIRDTSIAFFLVAAMQIIFGLFIPHTAMIVDGVIFGLLTYFLRHYKSKAAAITLLVFSLVTIAVTFINLIDEQRRGGSNIFLAAIMLYLSIRALMAVNKITGIKNAEIGPEDDESFTAS